LSEGGAPRQGLAPVVDGRTEVLILGSFPSASSLAAGTYYAHAQNQFWRIVGGLVDEPLWELEYAGRLTRLLAHGLGLWDVLASCVRAGSLDRDIRLAEVNDFSLLARHCPRLRAIVLNGGAAARHARHRLPAGLANRVVPSSSPAHAALPVADKVLAWRTALTELRDAAL